MGRVALSRHTVESPTATNVTGSLHGLFRCEIREKKNGDKREVGPDARVRTMAMTVKFKSAEIYNGRWLGARALTRMNATWLDREVSVTRCRKSAGDDATRTGTQTTMPLPPSGPRPHLLSSLFLLLHNEREGPQIPRDTRERFINAWAKMVTTRAIPVYGIRGHTWCISLPCSTLLESIPACRIAVFGGTIYKSEIKWKK